METEADTEPHRHSGVPGNGNDTGTGMGMGTTNAVTIKDLTDLPSDVFLLIISHLSPQDSILCRRVSRAWRAAFATPDVSWHLMRWHFPRCREMRHGAGIAMDSGLGPSGGGGNSPPKLKQKQRQRQETTQWAEVFPKVARRYHYLRAAKPRLIEKIDVMQQGTARGRHYQRRQQQQQNERTESKSKSKSGPPPLPHFRAVQPWNRHLRFDDYRADFQYRDPTWCVDDGLLVYRELEPEPEPEPDPESGVMSGGTTAGGRWVAYDLETRQRFTVPFDDEAAGSRKTVRRVRLACGVLIFEWCEAEAEPEPCYYRHDHDHDHDRRRETVYRHFATAFDVQRSSPNKSWPSSEPNSASSPKWSSSSSSTSTPPRASVVRSAAPPSSWRITFRSEWKIHFLGLSLAHDRFFSAHTATHYALYLWQPNRPRPWGRGRGPGQGGGGIDEDEGEGGGEGEEGEGDPLEQLTVWDISFPSAYRPSLDHDHDDHHDYAPSGSGSGTSSGKGNSHKRQRLLQQPPPPPLRPSSDPDPDPDPDPDLDLDLGPFVARRFGWRELDEVLGVRQRRAPSLRALALDDRNVYVHEEDHRWLAGPHAPPAPLLPRNHAVRCTGFPFVGLPAPRWFDQCCADGDVHMSFCPRRRRRRRDGMGVGRGKGRRLRGQGQGQGLEGGEEGEERVEGSSSLSSSSSSSSSAVGADDDDDDGRAIGGDGDDWPGWAPCWRHEEFPYLTVSDAVDARAGVRVVARQCFMMEALSAFVAPRISVEGERGREEEDVEEDEDKDGNWEGRQLREVRFSDDMWGELLARGKIEGDERWVVGEDREGRVTIVRF
ncbi:hypothetical protein SLS62_008962 [Diatrype stigma]|uniref:F-box domain-containing protein n=1 Tax=Diatrype stigma TaxID=117547 RepID=A0AAN9UJJ8_9PEZI